MRLLVALALLGLLGACKKDERRYSVGPVSVALPEGFIDDASRAEALTSKSAPGARGRVWVNSGSKMQIALSMARLPHQEDWEKVSPTVLLTEMFTQEKEAGEKAGLKTVDWSKRFDGEVLHYEIQGDMAGKLSTSSHTALWLDAKGDCWHASAVCTAPPAEKARCAGVLESVRFELSSFDAGPAR